MHSHHLQLCNPQLPACHSETAPQQLPPQKVIKKRLCLEGIRMAVIKKKKNWHEELCILQNKMCCFLICFYNPNKFVSHTPRLEKGAVRQFRIAVCSQLRQGICCKAVAANKCRFPAVLRLRRHRSGHRSAAARPRLPAPRRGR